MVERQHFSKTQNFDEALTKFESFMKEYYE